SGEMARPRCSKSSAVFTAIVRASEGKTPANPSASLAPPTPPASARILPVGFAMAETSAPWIAEPLQNKLNQASCASRLAAKQQFREEVMKPFAVMSAVVCALAAAAFVPAKAENGKL